MWLLQLMQAVKSSEQMPAKEQQQPQCCRQGPTEAARPTPGQRELKVNLLHLILSLQLYVFPKDSSQSACLEIVQREVCLYSSS